MKSTLFESLCGTSDMEYNRSYKNGLLQHALDASSSDDECEVRNSMEQTHLQTRTPAAFSTAGSFQRIRREKSGSSASCGLWCYTRCV